MENENHEIRKKSEEIDKKIKDSKQELQDLQDNCKHSEYDVKQVESEHGGVRTSLYKVCKFCKKTLGYPSKDDLKENGFG